MKKLSILLVVFLALSIAVMPALAITWGEPDTEHDYVGAMVVDWPDYGPYQVCSGTLVHPRIFLTAGHCTVDWEGTGVETFWVNFDQYALNEKTLLEVEQVIPHPDYYWGPTSDPHDVGVLVLKKPVKKITPARLPYAGYLDDLEAAGVLKDGSQGAPFTVVGYGGSLDFPPPSIYYEDIRQYAYSEYVQLLKVWLRTSQNQSQDNGGTCFGDSGGPIFWDDVQGGEVVVGVTSWGDANCVSSGFSYRVDIPQTLDFIDSVIASLDQTGKK
jgi:secreted trypsin-like serine protease